MRRACIALAGAAVAAMSPLQVAPVAGQQGYVYSTGSRPGWIGVGYELRWVQHDDACQPQVLVDAVVQGAPADRAGLRPGDAIVALNGEPVAGGQLQWLTGRLSPGDSLRLRVARGGDVRDLLAVADDRPDRPPTVLRTDPQDIEFYSRSGAPVVTFSGDTLIARNLDAGTYGRSRPRGVWVVDENGRTDYRRLDSRQGTFERRVNRLLVCVDSLSTTRLQPSVATRTITLQAIQERADSLRRLIAARALSQAESRPLEIIVRPSQADTVHVVREAPFTAVFGFDDQVVFANRGIAGAEMVEMEPELAAYFRNAREGILVLSVAEGTPAHRAGLEPGDVIVAGDGRRLESLQEVRRLFTLPDASPVELRVVRHGRTRTIRIPRG